MSFDKSRTDQAFARDILRGMSGGPGICGALDAGKRYATLYTGHLGPWRKREVTFIGTSFAPYAQYPRVLVLVYKEARQRKARHMYFEPGATNVVILDKWGHPDIPGELEPGAPGELVSRHTLGSLEWDKEMTPSSCGR